MDEIRQLNREEALAFAESGEWKSWTPAQRGAFQLQQKLLCMDFSAFHEGLEALLNRPVWTHELINPQALIDEWKGIKEAPSMQEILNLIPAEKLIVANI